MKDIILNTITMYDIVDKYNIEHRGKKMRCPFHGKDQHPSAVIYGKKFHCFTCQEHQDVIGFVEKYFNISFREAMQKINEDFGLGINSNIKVDYNKINEMKRQKKLKKKYKETLENKFVELCKTKDKYKKEITHIKLYLNLSNWENKIYSISVIEDKIGKIDMELDYLLEQMYKLKNSSY